MVRTGTLHARSKRRRGCWRAERSERGTRRGAVSRGEGRGGGGGRQTGLGGHWGGEAEEVPRGGEGGGGGG